MNIEKIKGDWKNQRCNPLIMASAYLYKPNDDPRSAGEFAEENFTFCTKALVDIVLATAFKPIAEALKLQMGAASSVSGGTNIIRQVLTNFKNTFDTIVLQFYKTFWIAFLQFRRVFERLLNIYNRIGAILTTALYFGLTLITTLMNMFDVIKIVIIVIMSILVALFILLIIPLSPILAVIVIVIASMAAVGIAVPGGDVFCFGPETLVEMEDGAMKPIKEVAIGDVLAYGCGKVEGVLEMDGVSEPLWSLDGILVSGSHILWNGSSWSSVAESGMAVKTDVRLPRLHILNTTSSQIPIRSPRGSFYLAKDWEELHPDDAFGSAVWDWLVDLIINGEAAANSDIAGRNLPVERPVVSKDSLVQRILSNRYTPISEIRIGDYIWDAFNKTYVKVLAVYKERFHAAGKFSDGNWLRRGECQRWMHPVAEAAAADQEGIQLITSTGSFSCWLGNEHFVLRDFTEIGIQEIDKTYPFILKRINLRFV